MNETRKIGPITQNELVGLANLKTGLVISSDILSNLIRIYSLSTILSIDDLHSLDEARKLIDKVDKSVTSDLGNGLKQG